VSPLDANSHLSIFHPAWNIFCRLFSFQLPHSLYNNQPTIPTNQPHHHATHSII
jgi:hypothetical protein